MTNFDKHHLIYSSLLFEGVLPNSVCVKLGEQTLLFPFSIVQGRKPLMQPPPSSHILLPHLVYRSLPLLSSRPPPPPHLWPTKKL
ncbi:hypothetical protein RIF29_01958 [Crotalaria pallida]|uniref:Uncharacterized protein n=1 Tax=Crotalaria pallida TaxID=3830 RepID=A0AAN9P7N2_CROPI